MRDRTYYVYVMASWTRVIYVGVTGNLEKRMMQHRAREVPGFTQKYYVHRLVHVERFGEVADAIAREKEIKGWRREKKVALIEARNPKWVDFLWLEEHDKVARPFRELG